jgi:hypothetical protein
MGERGFLQESYSSFEEFQRYDGIYHICERLGYPNGSVGDVWKWNPVIEKSVNPSDLRLVYLSNTIIQRKNGKIVPIFSRKKY